MGEESPKQRAFSFTLSLELEKLAAPKKKEIEELEYLQSFKIYYLLIFLFIYTLLLLYYYCCLKFGPPSLRLTWTWQFRE